MTLGERIKAVRKSVNLTQSELGDRIGVKGNTITNYEADRREPQEVTLKAICDKFGISYDWLRFEKGEMLAKVDDDILQAINRILSTEDEATRQVFRAFANFDARDWQTIEKMIDNLRKK